MPELKPCPFCGAQAHYVYVTKCGAPSVVVQCSHCLCRSDVAVLIEEAWVSGATDTAAAFWNKRVAPVGDVEDSTCL